jgi:signal transduction histidine kinase
LRNSSTSRDAPVRRAWLGPVLLLAAATVVVQAAAQPSAGRVDDTRYLRDAFGSQQGLSGGLVSAIAQTPDGYLWVGTEKALLRFDGLRFDAAIHATPSAGPLTRVLGLTTDADGTMWVRLQGARLVRYRDGRFDDVSAPVVLAEAGFTAMSAVQSGSVLMVGLRGGLVRARGAAFDTIVPSEKLPNSIVISLTETPGGRVWIGTRDVGLLSIHDGVVGDGPASLPDRKVNCLLPVGERDLWIGTDSGIARWNGDALATIDLPAVARGNQVLAMIRDRDGNVWAGTSRGLVRLDATGNVTFDERDSSSGIAITALFQDREGNVWVGSSRGIERFRAGAFTTYAGGDAGRSRGPVFVDAEGRAWFAPSTGGLAWLGEGRAVRITAASLSSDVVYSIDGDESGIWIGRQRGGVTQLVPRGGTFADRTFTERDGLAAGPIYAVRRSRDGSTWAASLTGGVSRIKDGRIVTYTSHDGLPSNAVTTMTDRTDGGIWFGTPYGLAAFANGAWQRQAVDGALPSTDIISLDSDDDLLWVGTAAGLALVRGGRVVTATDLPSALREPILGIADDRRGSLWIATSSRVLRVARAGLVAGSLAESDVREFGIADGLSSTSAMKRFRSVVADRRGRIWFSMNNGLSTIDAARTLERSAPAIVQIESISADGAALDPRKPLHLSSPRQRITFGYAGLSLSVPERVRFKYRLDGFDGDWSEPTAAREAVYTNLNPGRYRFRVAASNSDGEWNGGETATDIVIDPVIWQTTWFQWSAVGVAALAVLGVYRLRMRQLSQQMSVRFEERLAERTRIAQELHDTLLQGFLSASMQLHVATEQLPESSPARGPLARVLSLMGQVVDEGRNAVRGLRTSTSSPHDLEQAFTNVRDELGLGAHIAFRVIVEGQPRALSPLIRDEVYRIGREALVNAFRHSGAQAIELELHYEARHLRMLIRDDGGGIAPDVLVSGSDGHWGLSGMRERAERIGARFKVFSRASAGTEVELLVPARVAWQQRSGKRDRMAGSNPGRQPGSKMEDAVQAADADAHGREN